MRFAIAGVMAKCKVLSSRISGGVSLIYRDMIYTSAKSKEFFLLHSDAYGDSYTEDVTEDSLMEVSFKLVFFQFFVNSR
jgi:hypothetical protein